MLNMSVCDHNYNTHEYILHYKSRGMACKYRNVEAQLHLNYLQFLFNFLNTNC